MSTSGEYHGYIGGYHDYIRGCSVHRVNITSTSGGHYLLRYSVHREISRCMWGSKVIKVIKPFNLY